MITRSIVLPFILAATILALPGSGRAQTPDPGPAPIGPGERIRLEFAGSRSPRVWWTGRLIAVQDSTLTLLSERGDSLSVPRQHFSRIQAWRGNRSPAAGLAGGFAIGALVVGSMFGGMMAAGCSGDDSYFCSESPATGFGVGFLIGAIPGGVLGGALGLFAPGDRWREAVLPAPARPS